MSGASSRRKDRQRGGFVFTMEEHLEYMGLSYGTTMLRVFQASICLESDGCLRKETLWWISALKPFFKQEVSQMQALVLRGD